MSPLDTQTKEDFQRTVDQLRARLDDERLRSPSVGIVCGSGLSGLGDVLLNKVIMPYDEIEGFGRSTVVGHQSALAFGFLKGKTEAGVAADSNLVPVVAMLGRFHPYEGHSMASVVFPIRVMRLLGVGKIIITNAAGSLNPKIPVGTIVVVHDHIALPNLSGFNSLLGPVPTVPEFNVRFVPLSTAYSFPLRKLAFRAAKELQFPDDWLAEGTYAYVSGPTYETAAEGRFLRSCGADVVGMSTVPEVIAARQAGMEVMVLSLVTNPVVVPEGYRSARLAAEAEIAGKTVADVPEEEVSHDEVLSVGRLRGESMKSLVQRIVEIL